MNLQSFTSAINIIQIAASLLPVAAQVVQSVEQALPNTPGAQKLDVVKGILQCAYNVEQSAETAFESAWPALSAGISGIVAAFNASGLFKRATAPAAAAPAV